MEQRIRVDVDQETYESLRILASSVKMTIKEYLSMIVQDEWTAYERREVQYEVKRKRRTHE